MGGQLNVERGKSATLKAGWSHDGSTLTVKQLQKELEAKKAADSEF